MYYLYIFTGLVLLISLIADKGKTRIAVQISYNKIMKILPAFIKMLILVAIILSLVPEELIAKYLGVNSGLSGLLVGLFLGSITMMPGFIAFPLGGILLDKGVSYMNIAAFTTTLMLVGVLTYPVEKEYLGKKVTILRNTISFIIAVMITLITRIPMTLFEASFLGIKFSLIRLLVSLPLVILSSIWLGEYIERKNIVFQQDIE